MPDPLGLDEGLERLVSRAFAEGGDGGGVDAPEPVPGSRGRSLAERVDLECVGLTPLGWAVAMAPNGSLSEVPPALWAEYAEAAVA